MLPPPCRYTSKPTRSTSRHQSAIGTSGEPEVLDDCNTQQWHTWAVNSTHACSHDWQQPDRGHEPPATTAHEVVRMSIPLAYIPDTDAGGWPSTSETRRRCPDFEQGVTSGGGRVRYTWVHRMGPYSYSTVVCGAMLCYAVVCYTTTVLHNCSTCYDWWGTACME